jgi:23S rRNA (pseudouridine1915-N3)-methyltransferase
MVSVRVFLYFVGKARDAHANAMAEEYFQRARRYAACEMAGIKPGRSDPWRKHPAATKILLDAGGKQLDSAGFAGLISRAEREARDLVFLVGGADGAPAGWRSRADLVLSLSAMTWPHELARVLLAEQIYRAFALLRGHPYPR